jgi:archaellum component FlaG (FlaF/FlaG flagellin family)
MTAALLSVLAFYAGLLIAARIAAHCGTSLYRISRGMPRRGK